MVRSVLAFWNSKFEIRTELVTLNVHFIRQSTHGVLRSLPGGLLALANDHAKLKHQVLPNFGIVIIGGVKKVHFIQLKACTK